MKLPGDLTWKSTGKTLGAGGQATVQLVTKQGDTGNAVYALKGLRNGKPAQAYERFAREIKALKSVRHPNIVEIIDHSEPSDSFQFYVMPVVEGMVSLGKRIDDRTNPFLNDPIRSLDLFAQLCSAIHACETNTPAIVHRDLKPENILVADDGRISIIDFGICQISDHETLTLVDEGVGTQNYMAPECESGSDDYVDSRADIYSAGKVLWSAITGLRAFARERPVFQSKSMKTLFPHKPATWHLHHIFENTIRKNTSDRWARASDAVLWARHLKQMVTAAVPPLEEFTKYCPICRMGTLNGFNGSHAVFGNPNPGGIVGLKCSYCGTCMAIDREQVRQVLAQRENLE